MKILSTILLLFFCLTANGQAGCCEAKEYRAFDFWIGDWEVNSKFTGLKIGDNLIERIPGKTIIQENWTGFLTNSSTSFHHYDPSLKKWRQKWIDNTGNSIEFIGTVENDTARFTGASIHPSSQIKTDHRMMIAKVSEDEINQLWEQSVNEGPWNVIFNGQYLRKKSSSDHKEKSVYDYLIEAYQNHDHEIMIDLFSKEATLAIPDKKLITGNDNVKKLYQDYFKELAKKGIPKSELNIDLVQSKVINEIRFDAGYYWQIYEDNQGIEKSQLGTFQTTLIKEADDYYRILSMTINVAKSRKMARMIMFGEY